MCFDEPSVSDIPALKLLWKQAFGDPDETIDGFFSLAFDRRRCRIARLGGRTAAALYWFDCEWCDEPLAYIYAVATDEAYRGQGICHALMSDTLARLGRLGYAGAILVPGDAGLFGLYAGMGYHTSCHIGEFDCEASSDSPVMRRLGADEYAFLRRKFLPEGGVIQERENLAFLSLDTHFWVGDGVILAARREDDRLIGVELLGRPELAPGIVNALGCRVGHFRVPGSTRPFAMFRPLRPLPPPVYFGLPLD